MTRNVDAQIFIPSENEWYKAAYSDPNTSSYYDYPVGTDTQTVCSTPTSSANHANCSSIVSDATAVGSYTGSASPNGTFDQGGNVAEWNETLFTTSGNPYRVVRGGSFNDLSFDMRASARSGGEAAVQYAKFGFRVASPASAPPPPPPPVAPSLGPLGVALLGSGLMIAGVRKLRA